MGSMFFYGCGVVNPISIINDHDSMPIVNIASLLSLGFRLRQVAVVLCVISMAISLVAIIMTSNPMGVNEHKKDITSKMFIVFLISSLVTIFNIVKTVFENSI